MSGIAQITPCLYLSQGSVANNRQMLLARGITCIINAAVELPNSNFPGIEYYKVPVADMPSAPIALYFDSVSDKIQSVARKGGVTLVHCAAGVSRSATLCIAYLMKYQNASLYEAYNWVKARRPVIHPNVGFWRQLIQYELQLRGRNTVKMVPSTYGMVPDVYLAGRRTFPSYWRR